MIDPEVAPDTKENWFDVSSGPDTRQTDLGDDSLGEAGGGVLMHGRGSLQAHAPLDFTGPAIPQVDAEDTYRVAPGDLPAAPAPVQREPIRVRSLVVAGVAALVVIGLAAAWFVRGGAGATVAPTATPTASIGQDPVGTIAPPTELAGQRQGDRVVFTWTNPDPKEGDTFLYRAVLLDRDAATHQTDQPTASLAVQPQSTCIEVEVRRASGKSSQPAKKCVP